jgi:putative flippase GtrA
VSHGTTSRLPSHAGALDYPRTVRATAASAPARAVLRAYYGLGHLVRELMKFGVVGALAFVVDVAVFNLALSLTDKPLTSKTASTVVATTFAYLGNRHWTFRHRSRSGLSREYVLFFLLNGVGLAIALSCLAVSHYVLGFTSRLADNVAANGVGLALGTAFRFWSYRRWVFREAPADPEGTRVPQPS